MLKSTTVERYKTWCKTAKKSDKFHWEGKGYTQKEFDALTSWTYNLGVGNLQSSTLLKKLNAGDKNSVPSEMLRWNKASGKVLEGLTRRRQAEADLWVS